MLGQTLGHYKIEEKLGEGGMGVVYRASDIRLGRPVAIKILSASAAIDVDRKSRFFQEARAASALNHPHIITIYDIGAEDGVDYIAMEFVPGKTLDAIAGRKGLPVGEALRYAVQIADALAKAHAAGIIHRDLKPGNIMVNDDGQVKVLDFGLAKLAEPDSESAATMTLDRPRTEEGTIVGTVAYMSPEQAEGKKVDARTDIFSFGSVLYEMITGRRAFSGETKMSTLAAILNQEPKPVSEVSGAVPRDVERIIGRCLRKDPTRRIQTMMDLKVALEELKDESDSGRLDAPLASPIRQQNYKFLVAAAVIVAVCAAGATWWLLRSGKAAPERTGAPLKLTRLTSDAGLTTDPALSPDGKLVAYASDRSGDGNLDIWVQQISNGKARRLTRHAADDREPSFSPDGENIVFRSERDGGGVYVISTLGGEGEERLIAAEGRRPRFSPDGKQVAYTTGHAGSNLGAAGRGKIFVVSSAGGTPRQLVPDFGTAAWPVWSPDGKHILFFGGPPSANQASNNDWWVVAAEPGASAVRANAVAALRSHGLTNNFQAAGDWLTGPDRVLFSALAGDSTNLWQIALDTGTWQVTGEPQRLTSGTGDEGRPSAALAHPGRLVFSSLVENVSIWGLPIDASQGKVAGESKRLTDATGADIFPSLSSDGKALAFASNRSGKWHIWFKDLVSGKETTITNNPVGNSPGPAGSTVAISPDGSSVAYSVLENQKRIDYLVAVGSNGSAGLPEKLCEDCPAVQIWTPDGKKLFLGPGALAASPTSLALLDLATRKLTPLPAIKDIGYGHISPDLRWMAISSVLEPGRGRITVQPANPGTNNEPIAVTDGHSWDIAVEWSPDGSLLYFLSDRDGSRCLWAQRVDDAKRPQGTAFAVAHFHNPKRVAIGQTALWFAPVVTKNWIAIPLNDRTGNIWMGEM